MFDFGWAEILVIGAIALFVIGPQDIPKIAYSVGKFFRRLKYFQFALTSQFDDFMDKAEAKENRKEPKEELDHDPHNEAEDDEAYITMMPLPEAQSIEDTDASKTEEQQEKKPE